MSTSFVELEHQRNRRAREAYGERFTKCGCGTMIRQFIMPPAKRNAHSAPWNRYRRCAECTAEYFWKRRRLH